MKIPFIKLPTPDLNYFNLLIQDSIAAGHYSNFGPNEQALTNHFATLIGHPIVCCANATLALDGLHDLIHKINPSWTKAALPGFTFPATNIGCRISFEYAPTSNDKETYGYALFDNIEADYAITTAPFGSPRPLTYYRPNVKLWIVDNAAGATPQMEQVRDWLLAGADAVVVSLHATKSLSACEGGFVAFANKELYDAYKKYINFGFYIEKEEKKIASFGGSNHKMSELSASWARMSLDRIFTLDHERRVEIAKQYQLFCEKRQIDYIYSTQAFWICCPSSAAEISKNLLALGLETKPYYTPLYGEIEDLTTIKLSTNGLCLPTWAMSDAELDFTIQILEKCL